MISTYCIVIFMTHLVENVVTGVKFLLMGLNGQAGRNHLA